MRDIIEARRQCHRFIHTLSGNRPNCDDAGIAKRMLRDLDQAGEPSLRNRRILTRWCHTKGNVYQRGVPIAQAICLALYGRILTPEN